MTCKRIRESISESLASGGALPPAVLSHLEACADCRAAQQREKALFAAIDSGLCQRANAELPSGFVARARVRIAEQPAATRAWVPLWAVIALPAAVVLLLVVTRGIRPHPPAPSEKTEPIAQQVPSPAAPSPAPAQIVRPVGHAPSPRRAVPTAPAVAPHREPEVLVAAGEEASFLRSLKFLQLDGQALSPDRKALDNPLAIKPLELPLLDPDSGEKTGAAPANQQ